MPAEIVSLTERRARRAHPVLTQVEAYWDGLRNGRDCPSRAEIRPEGLTGVLSHSFVLERNAPGAGRFRVAGQHLTDLAKLEVRGLPISTLFLPDARDRLETALEQVYCAPAAQRLFVRQPGHAGRDPVAGQMLLLPLRDDLGHRSRVLGCLVMETIAPGRPARLDIEGISQRLLKPGGRLSRPAPAPERPPVSAPGGGADIIPLVPEPG